MGGWCSLRGQACVDEAPREGSLSKGWSARVLMDNASWGSRDIGIRGFFGKDCASPVDTPAQVY